MIAKLLTGHPFDPSRWFDGLGRAVLAHWLLLSALTVAVMLACWMGARWMRGWRERDAADAVWLTIRTPATVGADAGVFARRVAGVLHRTRQFSLRARHIVLEVHASDHGAQIGVWVPPGVDHGEVAAAITGAWPSADITLTTPPDLSEHQAVVAKEITARNGVWAPWIDPHTTTMTAGRGGHVTDPLGGVLDRLAARGEGETGLVQLVLGTYHRATVARLLVKGMETGLSELLALIRFAVFDTRSTPAAPPRPSGSSSPLGAARDAAVQAKQAAGPHIWATLRVGVSSTRALRHGRAAAAQIAGGFDAVATSSHSGGLVNHRTRHRAYRVGVRRPGRRFVATPAEVTALWHLPVDPARYGLPTVQARARTARPGLRLPGHTPRPGHQKSPLRLPRSQYDRKARRDR